MYGRRVCITTLCLSLMLALSAPCRAWLFDCGGPYYSGPTVKEGSGTVWVSQSFTLARDSCVTSFGAAVARAFGTSEMGFNLYLTDTLLDLSKPVIASGSVHPSGPSFSYKYVNLSAPVTLKAGQKYYVTLTPNSNNFAGSVCYSYKSGADYGLSSGDYGQTWSRYFNPLCVRVDGYPAPETDSGTTMLLGAVLLAGLVLLRRRFGSQAGADRA